MTQYARIEANGHSKKYTSTNVHPIATSATDAHAVGYTADGHPNLIKNPVYLLRHAAINTFLPTSADAYNASLITLTGWDANLTVPPWLFDPKVRIIDVTLTAARNWNTPTAADLVAYLFRNNSTHYVGGTYWEFHLGANGGAITFIPLAGCTFRGNTGLTGTTNNTHRRYAINLTDLRPGSEAYDFWIF